MTRTVLMRAAGAAALAAGLAMGGGGAAAAQTAGGDACSALSKPGAFGHTTVGSAKVVAADAAKGLPSFCEVEAMISPVKGSTIGVVYRLPEGWNGKILGLGGGGWLGNVRVEAAAEGLSKGYATAQTDGGHPATAPIFDPSSWASDPVKMTDFGNRAIHQMTVVAKEVAAKYYGKAQSKTYYQGCSTGGRQGLMEAQRYPQDYDAIIAGAPVYDLTVQTSAVVRDNIFNASGDKLTPDAIALANKSVLAACDAKDGLADGLIADPAACAWDPGEIQCKDGQAAGAECLSAGQVDILRKAYAGVQNIDGRVAAWPLMKGGELGWRIFVPATGGDDATKGGGMGGLRQAIWGDPNYDLSKFDTDADLTKVRTSSVAKVYDADDPAIGAFTGHGGKLLLWHGWSDPGPSPAGTIAYYEQVEGSVPDAGKDVRLFMLPGVGHCGGGPGPDRADWLDALDSWVKTGAPPETLLATKAKAKISRPLCAYPKAEHYKGSGDPDEAANFECK